MRSDWLRHLFIGAALVAAPLPAFAHDPGAAQAVAAATLPASVPAPVLAPVSASDFVLGRADAPITLIEYASLTCSHCAIWHNTVLPEIKSQYIDTGKVRLVYRTLPTQPQQVALTGAVLARCAGPDKFFDTVSALFQAQDALFRTFDVPAYLQSGLTAAGKTAEEVGACMQNPDHVAWLEDQIGSANAAGVTGTPTLFVNGTRSEDNSLDGMKSQIEAALMATSPTAP